MALVAAALPDAAALGSHLRHSIRREALAAETVPATALSDPAAVPLRHLAGGRLFGFAADRFEISGHANSPKARQIYESQSNLVTLTDLHWPGVNPSPGIYNWSKVDEVSAWAVAQGLRLHPHMYHDGDPSAADRNWPLPGWVTESVDNGNAVKAESVLRAFLAAQCARFAPVRDSVRLVTLCGEAIADGLASSVPGPGGIFLREGPFGRKLGTAQCDIAFDEVHRHFPNAELILNDYHLELNPARMDACLTLADDLVSRGIPVHGVGIEAHVTPWFTYQPAEMTGFLDALQGLGLNAHLTEMDLNDRAEMPADVTARDAEHAAFATFILDIYLAHPNVKSLTWWGISDFRVNNPRADGLPGRSLIWDSAYEPKPALYGAVADALRRHWGGGEAW
jgi:endo-1,4-beta-xylanase